MEEKTRRVIHQIREAGGVISNSSVIRIITGFLRDTDSSLLLENCGAIHVDKPVARRLLSRLQFVKRRGTAKAKVTPSEFQSLQEQFLGDIRSVIMLDSIPAKLIINWDYTGLNYVPASSRTLEVKGSQKFPIAAIDDKRQITVVLVCSLAGDFLPPHFIYGGKTPGCLPKASCPPGWHVTYINNHWANEESMLDYVHCIFLPFLEAAKKELKLPHNQPAWHYLIISEGN